MLSVSDFCRKYEHVSVTDVDWDVVTEDTPDCYWPVVSKSATSDERFISTLTDGQADGDELLVPARIVEGMVRRCDDEPLVYADTDALVELNSH